MIIIIFLTDLLFHRSANLTHIIQAIWGEAAFCIHILKIGYIWHHEFETIISDIFLSYTTYLETFSVCCCLCCLPELRTVQVRLYAQRSGPGELCSPVSPSPVWALNPHTAALFVVVPIYFSQTHDYLRRIYPGSPQPLANRKKGISRD